ncbi:MAG: hypothetical protein ABEJ05_08520 [Haloglomus sp.]
MNRSLSALFLGILLGVLLALALPTAFANVAPRTDDGTVTARVAAPAHDVTVVASCAPVGDGDWVGVVPLGGVTAVHLDYSVSHEAASLDVDTALTAVGPDEWVLTVTTEPDETKRPPADCTPGSEFDLAVTLPADFYQFRVVHDGTTVVTVDHPGSETTFRPLA